MVMKNNAFVRLPVSEAANIRYGIPLLHKPGMQRGVILMNPSKEF